MILIVYCRQLLQRELAIVTGAVESMIVESAWPQADIASAITLNLLPLIAGSDRRFLYAF
jgi:hypothetical protein